MAKTFTTSHTSTGSSTASTSSGTVKVTTSTDPNEYLYTISTPSTTCTSSGTYLSISNANNNLTWVNNGTANHSWNVVPTLSQNELLKFNISCPEEFLDESVRLYVNRYKNRSVLPTTSAYLNPMSDSLIEDCLPHNIIVFVDKASLPNALKNTKMDQLRILADCLYISIDVEHKLLEFSVVRKKVDKDCSGFWFNMKAINPNDSANLRIVKKQENVVTGCMNIALELSLYHQLSKADNYFSGLFPLLPTEIYNNHYSVQTDSKQRGTSTTISTSSPILWYKDTLSTVCPVLHESYFYLSIDYPANTLSFGGISSIEDILSRLCWKSPRSHIEYFANTLRSYAARNLAVSSPEDYAMSKLMSLLYSALG